MKIQEWLSTITEEGPLPDNCKAIYIGIFEGASGYTLHFLGSLEYDANDDDWACEDDGDYMPEHRYLESGISLDTPWEDFLNEVVSIIGAVRSTGDTVLSQIENVAVGFDSGDLERV